MEVTEDILINEVLSRMSLSDILRTCQVDRRLANLCQRDDLWHLLTQRDFPEEVPLNPGLPWREYYMTVYRSPLVPVYYFSRMLSAERLTPYNLTRIIGSVQDQIGGLIESGYPVDPNSTIVFTDSLIKPVAYFSKGKFNIFHEAIPMRKIVLLNPTVEISSDAVLSNLTRGDPSLTLQGGFRNPAYGYVNPEGEVFIGNKWARRPDEFVVIPCKSLLDYKIIHALLALDLTEEAYKLVPNLLAYPSRQLSVEIRNRFCEMIVRALRERGLILNEPYSPKGES